MSMIEYMKFEDRSEIIGKSWNSHVLIMNFFDSHIITLAYVLETPIEVTSIEFHPENSNVLFGGCINGQIIVWDLTSQDHRIQNKSTKNDSGGGGDDETAPAQGGGEDDDKQQSIIKMKHMAQSSIYHTHKNFVSDLVFVPGTIDVDKRAKSEGKQTHFISCSEDGIVQFWDSRQVDKEELKKNTKDGWKPFNRLEVYRMDGTGELGLSRILLQSNQTTPLLWATSDEGDLCLIDWSVRPILGGDDGPKITEYVKHMYESEKEYR